MCNRVALCHSGGWKRRGRVRLAIESSSGEIVEDLPLGLVHREVSANKTLEKAARRMLRTLSLMGSKQLHERLVCQREGFFDIGNEARTTRDIVVRPIRINDGETTGSVVKYASHIGRLEDYVRRTQRKGRANTLSKYEGGSSLIITESLSKRLP